MNSVIYLTLGVNSETQARLDRLRVEFARACNWVAPIAKQNHCWNRVALHHLSYHQLRSEFPNLGSQMACNAIYSVCRSYRLLLSHPESPFFEKKIVEGALPQIYFLDTSPVFFDRHTLSLQNKMLSLFTLEGRLRFGISLSDADEQIFRTQKLREIQLTCHQSQYCLFMQFADEQAGSPAAENIGAWPDYMVLQDLAPGQSDALGNPANQDAQLQKVS